MQRRLHKRANIDEWGCFKDEWAYFTDRNKEAGAAVEEGAEAPPTWGRDLVMVLTVSRVLTVKLKEFRELREFKDL